MSMPGLQKLQQHLRKLGKIGDDVVRWKNSAVVFLHFFFVIESFFFFAKVGSLKGCLFFGCSKEGKAEGEQQGS